MARGKFACLNLLTVLGTRSVWSKTKMIRSSSLYHYISLKYWDTLTSYQGPVIQSVVSLMSSLVVKMLTVLLSTISSSQVFLLKNVNSFFKCKNITVYGLFNDQSFDDVLTKDIVSFERLGPDLLKYEQVRFITFLCV